MSNFRIAKNGVNNKSTVFPTVTLTTVECKFGSLSTYTLSSQVRLLVQCKLFMCTFKDYAHLYWA